MQITWSFFTGFLIFISQTFIGVKAGCVWNGVCVMQCITQAVFTEIEQLWAGKDECHSNGIKFRLMSITYPNNTIAPHWFTANIKEIELEVNLRDVVRVSPDAFNANAFATVKKLTIENLAMSLIENGIFNGLDQLEIINIKYAQRVNKIENGVLDTLTELQEFTFEQTSKHPEISINGLTGSEALSKLEYVKIHYNLTNSIKKFTFVGLTNVKRLHLSSCQIKSIEDNSFDPISETIEELDLSGNALTTLSYGVFSMVLPNIRSIKINGNSWHCDCDLLPFRLFVEQYQDNFIGFDCSSPTECRISNMLESDCFTECDTPTTTTSAVTTTDSTTIQTSTSSSDGNLMIQCHNDTSVSMKRPIGSMTIEQNDNGEVNLKIENGQDVNSLVVIWFDENRNSEEINCISKNEIDSIPMPNLKTNIIYTFCLMDKTIASVSPLDCVSYMKRDESSVWLFESSKTLTVTLIVISLVLNIVVGIAIGFWMVNHNPFSKHNNQTSKFSMDSHNFGQSDDVRDKTTSNIYSRNTILLTNSLHGDTFKCPPLPERPSKFFEEPVYASVEDK